MNLEEQQIILKEKLANIQSNLEKKKYVKGNTGPTKFYHFDQNNSGGSFRENEDVTKHVFIEAHSAEEANLLADNFGIYFDGCDMGVDCSCCGDRWHPVREDAPITLNRDSPTMWQNNGTPDGHYVDVHEVFKDGFSTDCIIHFLNGTKEHVVFKTISDCPGHQWQQQYDIGKKCTICHVWESELKKVK